MRLHARSSVSAAALAVVALLIVLVALNWGRAADMFQVPAAAPSGGERRLLMLVVDRLSYRDLRQKAGPALQSLLDGTALSLMNVRAGRAGSESGYLSLGAGARAAAGLEGGRAFRRNEIVEGYPAAALYQRYSGRPPAGELFHLHALTLQERNQTLGYPVAVGYLGELLAGAGLRAAVVGHADTDAPGRSAVMIAMDRAGQVALGANGFNVVVDDPLYPYGKRTDPERFTAAALSYLQEAHLVVADYGDLARLDQYWAQLSPERREELFTAAMASLDRIIEDLLLLCGDEVAFMLVVPSPPVNLPGGGDQLVPFIMAWPGGGGPTLLSSPATRREGLVSNIDVAPLVYSYLVEGAFTASNGRAMAVNDVPEPAAYLERFAAWSQWVFQLRAPVVKGFVLAIIAVLLAGLACLFLRLPAVKRLFFILEGLVLVPLVLFLLPGLIREPLPPLWTAAVIAGGALLFVFALYPLKQKDYLLFWSALGLITAVALLADTIYGAGLQQSSFLGYDPIGGSRYYGMGNEYMGALIGSAILGTAGLPGLAGPGEPVNELHGPAWRRAFRLDPLRLAILLFYGLVIFVLASPRFGANLGGTIAAAAAFGTVWAGLSGFMEKRHLLPLVLTILAFTALALGLLYLLNLPQQGPVSHLGSFGEMVRQRGFEGAWETALRKMSMNWRLIRYSIWSRAFATLIGLLVILFFYPVGILRKLKKEQPCLVNGAAAALAGSVAALLANDSGIVAAAMVLLYAAPPVLMLIVSEHLSLPGERGSE